MQWDQRASRCRVTQTPPKKPSLRSLASKPFPTVPEAMGFDLELDVLPSATDAWQSEEKVTSRSLLLTELRWTQGERRKQWESIGFI